MNLHDLSPDEGSKTEGIRVGRGRSGPRGETCGRGLKGQKKRNQIPPHFEGGQTPLYRRLPKFGFTPPNRQTVQTVNIYQLNRFDSGETVDPERLREEDLISGDDPVKLLGDGSLDVTGLTVRVHDWSSGAETALDEADGSVEPLTEQG